MQRSSEKGEGSNLWNTNWLEEIIKECCPTCSSFMFLSLESKEVRGCLVLQLKAKLCGHSLVQLSVLTLVFSRCIGAVQWHLRGPSPAPSPLPALLPGRGGTLYNGLYGEAPPERGTFFRLQVYERVGILLVEERKGGEICHLGLWKGLNGLTWILRLYNVEKTF